MAGIVLIKDLSIRAGDKNILSGLDFEVADCRMTAIMGPMGGGKSTLLKFLAAALPSHTYDISCKTALYAGHPISDQHHPRHILQYPRDKTGDNPPSLMARLADIEGLTRGNTDMLCIDEPTAGLEANEGEMLMQALDRLAMDRAVLMVSHNTREVRAHCHHVALIGGGRVVTSLPAPDFYDMKTDPHAIHYICTGGLDLPDVETPILLLAPEHRESPEGFVSGEADPGEGVENWIIDQKLALMNLPAKLDLSTAHTVFRFQKGALQIYSPDGEIENTLTWHSEADQPDRNEKLTVEICRMLQRKLAAGERITLDTSFNQTAVSAILGAFLILRGFSPANALEITAQKLPTLHLGMRLEEFLWNIDLELSS